MASWNPHKQGEHVFNDIGGSLANAVEGALAAERLRFFSMWSRFGPIVPALDLPSTAAALDSIARDPVLVQARTVAAPATGVHDDANSQLYGSARARLERCLADLAYSAADLAWKKKPRSGSSFHEFEAVVAGVRDSRTARESASAAVVELMDAARDPAAERDALAETVSDIELRRRRDAIEAMKREIPRFKQQGRAMVETFAAEVGQVFERRVNAS